MRDVFASQLHMSKINDMNKTWYGICLLSLEESELDMLDSRESENEIWVFLPFEQGFAIDIQLQS